MTLILGAIGHESIWMLADRRLSYSGLPPKDDACKILSLEAKDGCALVGYSGLGSTSNGLEPSKWMSAALRGRNLPLQKMLDLLASIAHRELPKHLKRFPRNNTAEHVISITAFMNGKPRLFSIGTRLNTDRKQVQHRYNQHVASPNTQAPPRFIISGSGETYLSKNKHWMRHLSQLIHAYEDHKISPMVVAGYLGELNFDVSQNTNDKSVGPSCIVVWRNKKTGKFKGGGAQCHYTNGKADQSQCVLPSIGGTLDVGAILNAIHPIANKWSQEINAGNRNAAPDFEALNIAISQIREDPDENLH